MELTLEQAMQNVKNVVEAYKGTYQEHVALQQSIILIEAAAKKSQTPSEK